MGWRHQLNGNGSRPSAGGTLTTDGCGGADGITVCSGYELTADIDLSSFDNGGKGWLPIGHEDLDKPDEPRQHDPIQQSCDGGEPSPAPLMAIIMLSAV